MREIMHFSTTKERLKYLTGGFEEIIPVEVTEKAPEKVEKEPEKAKTEKKSPKKASKGKKKAKKVEENGEVQAE